MLKYFGIALSIVAAIGFVGGCDVARGVSRSAPLTSLPAAASVDAALRATPSVRAVDRRDVPATDNASLYKGTIRGPVYPQFVCRGDVASVTTELWDSDTGGTGKRLYIYCWWLNHVPTTNELAETRELIDQVYESLHECLPEVPPLEASQESLVNLPSH